MKKILILLFLFCCSNHRIMAQIMVGEPYHFCTLSGEQYNPGVHGDYEDNSYYDDKWVVTIDSKDYTRYEKTFIQ